MSSVMKTLLLNPPSFEKFDGGAGSRWPATREIESYWYPVWLAYAAGMLPGSRLLDAPPHHIKPEEVIRTAQNYDFLVLFTSTVGFFGDLRMARAIKERKPDIKICFVGPHVQIKPAESLLLARTSISSYAASSIIPSWSSRRACRCPRSGTPVT